jgi:hypothetical protein
MYPVIEYNIPFHQPFNFHWDKYVCFWSEHVCVHIFVTIPYIKPMQNRSETWSLYLCVKIFSWAVELFCTWSFTTVLYPCLLDLLGLRPDVSSWEIFRWIVLSEKWQFLLTLLAECFLLDGSSCFRCGLIYKLQWNWRIRVLMHYDKGILLLPLIATLKIFFITAEDDNLSLTDIVDSTKR